jgi:predicted porin
MKKTLIALAVLAVSGAAFAQSTVTLSGSINVGVMDTGAVGQKAGVASLGNGANAINIASSEDLGGGLRGGFTGQIRYSAATGDMNSAGLAPISNNVASSSGNQLLHAANAFISGGFGTVRVGKIAEAGSCAFDPWGCTAGAGLMAGSAGGVSALVGAGTQANSVSYATPTINGFSGGYQTTMTNPDRAKERSVLNLNYAQGPVTLAYVQVKGGGNSLAPLPTGAAIATTGDNINLKQDFIGARYNLGVATIGISNSKTEVAGTTTADVTALTAVAPMGAYTLLAGYAKAKTGTGYTATALNDTRTAVGVNYALSKRTTLGADLFKAEAGANTGNGFVLRVGHTF